MRYSTPEQCGICTSDIKDFIDRLEADNLTTHSVIIMRGSSVILEKYWSPFNRELRHRLYSVTKSFVSLAIGFLADEGKISLDDPISRYFPSETEGLAAEIRGQTVRDMLMMRTAFPKGLKNWFTASPDDRVEFYFRSGNGYLYPSGTMYQYDSNGSFILCALAERVSGKDIVTYLDEKLFSHIGVEGAYALKCPGGHSWGDSALIMRPIDLARSARFVMNGGSWEGKQLISADYIREAVSCKVPTTHFGEASIGAYGYGYQFWCSKHGSFFFNGMGCQLALCCPDHDLILVYNGDNQGNPVAKDVIFNAFFDTVYKNASDTPLEEYRGAPIPEHELFFVRGSATSPMAQSIGGKRYTLEKNPMGISELCLSFGDSCGMLTYTNARGTHEIPFGIGKNACGLFPEEGYSSVVGSKPTPGHKYKMAASGAWLVPDCFLIRVQAIDEYFGNLSFMLSFKDDRIALRCMKCAENFFFDYGDGYAHGKSIK